MDVKFNPQKFCSFQIENNWPCASVTLCDTWLQSSVTCQVVCFYIVGFGNNLSQYFPDYQGPILLLTQHPPEPGRPGFKRRPLKHIYGTGQPLLGLETQNSIRKPILSSDPIIIYCADIGIISFPVTFSSAAIVDMRVPETITIKLFPLPSDNCFNPTIKCLLFKIVFKMPDYRQDL